MPAAGLTDLIALALPAPALAAAARAAWDAGDAVLPLPAHATAPEREQLLATLRPTVLVDTDGRHRRPDGVPVDEAVAAVVPTSGTTGTSKGAELTRAGMELAAHAYAEFLDARPVDAWLACTPLHHVAGIATIARAHVTGLPLVVHDQFDVDRVASAPDTDGATIVLVVPTMLRRLVDARAPLGRFHRVVVGASALSPELRARAEELGARIVETYGMTETWGGVVLEGRALRGVGVRIAEDGEVLLRGAMVMRGYRLDPERTAEVLDADGWIHTGDIGELAPDGRLRVVDRIKDLVISGGVNVSPVEVEGVLSHHPAVADVCIVGAPDDEWGERVVAFVVPRDPDAPPSLDDLRDYARATLSPPNLPRELRLVTEIPRSASGKPLRRHLRE
ncbi:MAG TPA: fatty acid--CoA ligase family protein [Acidimicrobiia bacterium]|nr:fatty acid--CoA ligase family protein [Acidimicrobiia bacterium]